MNHSCENTSLQNVSMENLQFPGVHGNVILIGLCTMPIDYDTSFAMGTAKATVPPPR